MACSSQATLVALEFFRIIRSLTAPAQPVGRRAEIGTRACPNCFANVIDAMNGKTCLARFTPTHTIDFTASGESDEEIPPIVTHDHLAEPPSAGSVAWWHGPLIHSLGVISEVLEMQRILFALAMLVTLGGCASIAQVEIVDRPNYEQKPFRYILWKGEKYGPLAFEAVARNGVSSIALHNASPDGLRCVAALSGALSIPAVSVSSNGASEPISPSNEKIQEACSVR